MLSTQKSLFYGRYGKVRMISSKTYVKSSISYAVVRLVYLYRFTGSYSLPWNLTIKKASNNLNYCWLFCLEQTLSIFKTKASFGKLDSGLTPVCTKPICYMYCVIRSLKKTGLKRSLKFKKL
jgi:Pyruvate/2-oxoacid:ferredoxin oxidoreductase delta subunit